MTITHRTPGLRFADMDAAVAAMRRLGLRLSTPRRLILRALFDVDGPVSAEHIAAGAGLDVGSVYRNLDTMERAGLVRHVHLGHGPGLYVLVGRGEHEYLYCDACGAVVRVPPPELDAVRDLVRERFGYEARFTHFAIVGLCPACAAAPPATVADLLHPGEEEPPVWEPASHGHQHGTAGGPAGADHPGRDDGEPRGHGHEHSHGDYVHSHPHAHAHPSGLAHTSE